MSLRSLGYLLTRRFYPRKIYSLQAEGIVSVPAAGRPGRSLHSLRDLSAHVSSHHMFLSLVAPALAGAGLGILISKKHPDDAGKDTKRDVGMEARFHKWMKRVGRVYPNHEEETRRFELFKRRVKLVESLHKSSFEYLPNKFADRSDEEIIVMTGDSAEYEREALLRITQAKMLEEETSTAAQKK